MSNARNLANLLGTNTKVKDVDVDGTELILDADADTSITADTDDQIDFKTGGTDRVVINSSGAVSIGTTSNPNNSPLLIHCASDDNIRIKQETDASIQAVNDAANAFVALKIDGNDLLLNSQSGGNVIIGETSQINGGFLNLATSGASNALSFLCRSTDNGHQNQIIMQKSSTNSGNFAATSDNESLGSILFRGVNTSGVSDIGGYIEIVQDGTSSSTVPAEMRFGTTETERMRIDSSGNVHIGRTDELSLSANGVTGVNILPGGIVRASASGDASGQFARQSSFGEVIRFACAGTGNVGSIDVTTSATSYNTSSDYRLKENVVTDWDASSRLKQLKPSRFNFKIDKDRTLDGFIAHEVSSIVPEAVSGEKDAVDKDGNIDPQGIDHSKLVPLLTKALQEAISEIDTLKAKVTALEAK